MKNGIYIFCIILSLLSLVAKSLFKKEISSKDISYFNKIRSKTIDFVITDINGKIITCIELDDPSHVKDNRQERDNFIDELFKQLDISLIRIPVQGYYDMQEIENKIKEKI